MLSSVHVSVVHLDEVLITVSIRLDVTKYKHAKTHKKVLNRMKKYLDSGHISKEINEDDMDVQGNESSKKEMKDEVTSTATPSNVTFDEIKQAIISAIQLATKQGAISESHINACSPLNQFVKINENPVKQKQFGDVSCNIAVIVAGRNKKDVKPPNPLDVAKSIVGCLPNSFNANVSDSGFINFTLPPEVKPVKQKPPKTTKVTTANKPLHSLEVSAIPSCNSNVGQGDNC